MSVATPEVRRVLKSAGPQREIVFLLLDGFRHRHDGQDEVALCAVGVTWEGTAKILAARRASREDEASWGAFLAAL